MFKRPIPRAHPLRPSCGSSVPIPTGTPGRVGEIITAMHRGTDAIHRPRAAEWRPSYDYEFVARHQDDPEAYLARSRAWLDSHPPPVRPPPKVLPAVDFEPIHKLFAKYPGQRPPIAEHVAAMREAGYSEEHVERAIARDNMLNSTADARQEALDAIFARWPSINKPTPKPRTSKPIKAVKKKMN
jgi:hypothetical protein